MCPVSCPRSHRQEVVRLGFEPRRFSSITQAHSPLLPTCPWLSSLCMDMMAVFVSPVVVPISRETPRPGSSSAGGKDSHSSCPGSS